MLRVKTTSSCCFSDVSMYTGSPPGISVDPGVV